jgi:hypothetical protein
VGTLSLQHNQRKPIIPCKQFIEHLRSANNVKPWKIDPNQISLNICSGKTYQSLRIGWGEKKCEQKGRRGRGKAKSTLSGLGSEDGCASTVAWLHINLYASVLMVMPPGR